MTKHGDAAIGRKLAAMATEATEFNYEPTGKVLRTQGSRRLVWHEMTVARKATPFNLEADRYWLRKCEGTFAGTWHP